MPKTLNDIETGLRQAGRDLCDLAAEQAYSSELAMAVLSLQTTINFSLQFKKQNDPHVPPPTFSSPISDTGTLPGPDPSPTTCDATELVYDRRCA